MAATTSNFKLIFISVFAVAAVAGILIFSGLINVGSGGAKKITGSIVVWGTIDQLAFQKFMNAFNIANQDIHATYFEKDPETFDSELIEAIAANSVPDLVLLPDNLVWRFRDKFTHIPFTSLPQQTFQTTFINGADIFLASDGVIGIPWLADPLVMYYNEDLLAAAGIAQAPKTWPDFVKTIPLVTKKQNDLTVTQAGVSLGTYKNVTRSKDMLALLFMQSGNQFITRDGAGRLLVHFGTTGNNVENTLGVKALDFYTSFADPVREVYSWNEGMPRDRDAFVRGTLVYYFGRASELAGIRAENPNLNFNVALPPQFVNAAVPMTTGGIYALSVPKGAANQVLSYSAATLLANAASQKSLLETAGATFTLVPTRRDVLAEKPVADPYMTLLYNTALVLRTWVDPEPRGSDTILRTLVSNIRSNITSKEQSLLQAGGQMSVLGASI